MINIYLTQEDYDRQCICPFCGGYCEEDADNEELNFCYGCNENFDPNCYNYVVVKYNQSDFEEMVRDFIADNEEMSDLLIIEIEYDTEGRRWVAYVIDSKTAYVLSDDGTGSIAINYSGTR